MSLPRLDASIKIFYEGTLKVVHFHRAAKLSLPFFIFISYGMNMQTPPLECTSLPPAIAPCEHIAGNEKFILKAFQIQEKHLRADGRSLVDVTLDLEDGAPVGQEEPLRHLFATLLKSPANTRHQAGIRIHPPSSPDCTRDLEVVVSAAGDQISYITIPKVRTKREVLWCIGLIKHYLRAHSAKRSIPLHLLIETPEAVKVVDDLAAIPDVETLDFGLMDFISQVGGAIPSTCMKSPGQFDNQIIATTKSCIASAALRHNKVPSHNVTVDVRNPEQAFQDAYRARHEFGFLRMWSIHPDQVDRIIRAMSPSREEVLEAQAIITAAAAAHWGPIEIGGRLHDRASFRYYWGVLNASGSAAVQATLQAQHRP
jgi:citrate lyase subunit beta/citryl-CoA lyase